MARALGFRFLDSSGAEIQDLPHRLHDVALIDDSAKPLLPEFLTACDVDNPLLGAKGATRIYGPQKGIGEEELELHEARLSHLGDLVQRDLGIDVRSTSGAGAAGGLGFGTIAFCDGKLQPGFELVAELLDLERQIRDSDLIITGEGSLDAQTLHGKGPHGVAVIARRLGKPVLAFAGAADDAARSDTAFDRIVTIRPEGVTVDESMRRGAEFLRAAARETAPWVHAQILA